MMIIKKVDILYPFLIKFILIQIVVQSVAWAAEGNVYCCKVFFNWVGQRCVWCFVKFTVIMVWIKTEFFKRLGWYLKSTCTN